jgi:hypothetical protein
MAKQDDSALPLPFGYPGAARADRREPFARETRRTRDDREAERAFLTSKIELVRSDPRLTDEEKERAVVALQSRIDDLAEDGAESAGDSVPAE